jgi:histidine ammonia-lyase
VLKNLERILAIEALCAAQALEQRAPLEPGPATSTILKRIRRDVPFMEKDRFLAPELKTAEELVHSAGDVLGPLA